MSVMTNRTLDGRQAEATAKYFAKMPAARERAKKKWNNSARHRAHNRCRKYGVPLKFYENLGWYPPDIREALDGSNQGQTAG